MESVSLRELSDGYGIVVFDTSVVIGGIGEDGFGKDYLRLLKDLEYCDNFVTIANVKAECPKSLRNIVNRKVIPFVNFSRTLYREISEFLLPIAEELGVVERGKRYPETDINLATLAFCMSHARPYVAFVSSDRKLNELVFLGISDGMRRRFPCSLNAPFHVFSYVQRSMACVSYDEERMIPQYNSSRQSGQSSLS